MKRYLFIVIAIGFCAPLGAETLSPLFETGAATFQTFSSVCAGYGALGEDQSQVAVYVSRRDAERIPLQAPATVRLGASEDMPVSVSGKVTEVLSDADPRTGQAIVTLAIPHQNLAPRTYASASIELGGRRALALQTTAIIISSGTAVVYRQTKPGEFEEVPVQIGVQNSGFTEVKSGLRSTDTVLIKGALEWARRNGSGND